MDGRFLAVLVVLNIFVQLTVLVYGEDVSVSSVFIERIAVNTIRRLLCGQNEDCSRSCLLARG